MFLELDIDLLDSKLQALGLPCEGGSSKLWLKEENIIAFRPGYNEDGEEKGTLIYTSDGENYWVNQSLEDVKTLLI